MRSDDDDDDSGARVRSSVGLWLLAALLIVGGVAAALSVVNERSAERNRDRQIAEVAVARLDSVLERTVGGLRGADGLVADGNVSEPEFQAFADSVLNDTLFPLLAFTQIVSDADLAAFESDEGIDVHPFDDTAAARADADAAGGSSGDGTDGTDGTDRSDGSDADDPSFLGQDHVVVRYVHPSSDTNRALIGLDLASDPVRRGAAERTIDAGAPALAVLDQLATSRQPGLFGILAVRAPDRSVIGFVSGAVDFGQVFALASEGLPPGASVSVRIDGVLIGEHDGPDGDGGAAGSGRGAGGAVRTFRVGGLTFEVTGDDGTGPGIALPALISAGTCTLALAVVLTARRDRRLRAERERTLERNRSLAELGQRLAAAVTVDDIVAEVLATGGSILGAWRITVGIRSDLDPDVLVVRSADVDRIEVSPPSAVPLDGPGPAAAAVRDAEVVRTWDGGTWHPLQVHGGDCVGVVGVEWASGTPGDAGREPAAATLSELTARAVERAVITEAVQQGAARLSALARALASAATSVEVADVVRTLVPAIAGCASAEVDTSPAARTGAAAVAEPGGEVHRLVQVVRNSAGDEVATIDLRWAVPVVRTPTLQAVLDTIADLVGLTLARTGVYDQEHQLITELQTALLPPAPDAEGLEIVVRYAPASRAVGIGGDWYDVVAVGPASIDAVIGDVSGHGPTAVTTMAQLKAVIAHLLALAAPAGEVYEHANAMLAQQGAQATAQIVHIDLEAGVLTAASAGHPDALLRRSGGAVSPLPASRRPLLGVRWRAGGAATTPLVTTPFEPGDLLLMFTDGLVERRRTSIDAQLGRLVEALERVDPDRALAPQIDELIGEIRSPSGDDRAIDDDCAVIAIRRRAPGV